jgi:hypothetical protein
LIIRTRVNRKVKSTYPVEITRCRTGQSDRVRPIPGFLPPVLELTGLGCQNRKGYLRASSDASFHTFRLTFGRALVVL